MAIRPTLETTAITLELTAIILVITTAPRPGIRLGMVAKAARKQEMAPPAPPTPLLLRTTTSLRVLGPSQRIRKVQARTTAAPSVSSTEETDSSRRRRHNSIAFRSR